MARKMITSVADVVRRTGAEPGDYLFRRLRRLIDDENHAEATDLALQLLPYVRRKLAPQPIEEVRQAAQEGRLVITASVTDAPES